VAIGVFVANPPIEHFQSLLLGNATIAPFNNPAKSIDERAAKTSRWAPRGETGARALGRKSSASERDQRVCG
jgi:hypothetical protein